MRDQIHETPDMILNSYRFGAAAAGISEPLHWWDLDDDGWADDGNGTPMPLVETGTPNISSGGGPNGQDVLNLTGGGSQYLSSNGNKVWDGETQNFSVSCWAKAAVIASTGNWIVSWREGGIDRLTQIIFSNSSGKFGSLIGDEDDNFDTVASITSHNTTNWFHIVSSWDGTDLKIYVNGGAAESTETPVPMGVLPTAAIPFKIGDASWSPFETTSHDGRIGMVGIWDSALTQAEVDHLYNSGNGRQYADLTIL